MAVRLNHTIVWARERRVGEVPDGDAAPRVLGEFAVVQLGDTSLDYMDIGEDARDPGGAKELKPQHYAFLVSELERRDLRPHPRAQPAVLGRSRAPAAQRGTTGVGSTSTTRTATCSRSSPARTAAAARPCPGHTRWSCPR
jgi:hypothetical protein